MTGGVVRRGASRARWSGTGAASDAVVGRTALYVLVQDRDEVADLIGRTVARWYADDASRRIGLQVGRDLQFIRINGTAVGALAGLAIHTVTMALT